MVNLRVYTAGILLNLLVVTTVRHHDHLQTSTTNLLLLNLCFSNLIVSFLGKNNVGGDLAEAFKGTVSRGSGAGLYTVLGCLLRQILFFGHISFYFFF
jgi:hypothetical protein